MVGKTISHYEILDKIGQSEMGEALEAAHEIIALPTRCLERLSAEPDTALRRADTDQVSPSVRWTVLGGGRPPHSWSGLRQVRG